MRTLLVGGCAVGVDAGKRWMGAVMDRLGEVAEATDRTPQRIWSVDEVPGGATVSVDGRPITLATSTAAVAAALTGDLELWVAEHAPGQVWIHSACVAVAGRAMVMPGRTLAGKSTLAAALVAEGAEYFSDEYAVLDLSGGVHPYARPLGLRTAGEDGLPRSVPTPVEYLGGRRGTGPVALALLVGCGYSEGADLRLRPVGAASGALLLMDNAVAARSRSQDVLDASTRAVRSAQVVCGVRGDAGEAARTLMSMINSVD